ncbi:MAG: nucleotidyl transferase AbiEii/AbiGii toxin family protein [Candidatus Methanoperedens sp.]|nr:nucleotidyl transferase AbiEii/AbiGii toxin family protein [Candidatus Methanoperedens sp.]MCZ7395601.1 nucleotidyl transferase AbiEii/AbiGii toxin family protein [Candidatus Methanoperedens sp.]
MLSRKNLESMKSILGYNLGQVESDYLQHILLLFLSRRAGNWLVLKGGTALQKAYGLNRFSDDLDFTSKKEDIEDIAYGIRTDLATFGLENELKINRMENVSEVIVYSIKGPLYDGTPRSMAVQRVEVSQREKVILKEEIHEVVPVYPDLQPYLLTMMNLEEILSEKVRAIMTRNKARDVYDTWFLIKKKIPFNPELINKKLEYYDMVFDLVAFTTSLMDKNRIWERELKPLVSFIPDFEKTAKEILEAFS